MNGSGDSEITTADLVDWGRAKDVFLDALEVGAAERRDLVDRACGDDAALRDAVEKLLESHASATDFLTDVVDDARTPVELEDPLPGPIGPYHPVERLGEGGYGTVYRAVQHAPIEREVALKVLKAGLEAPEHVGRFMDERRFLARMNHPEIVQIFDAGATPEGRLFVAMELADGLPLNVYAAERGLDVRERIALVIRLCRAAQHAHQRAVIHRDLKPSNVLVTEEDGAARLRVIDFGIAQAIDTDRAGPGADRAVGTPRYVSPEQASGTAVVDVRTDVYAIGVLLCELLTGRPPREPATGTGDRATGTDAVPPSRLLNPSEPDGRRRANSLRGDLDRIVLKAVAWEPDERYDSAAALGDDLERLLRGETVTATPRSAHYALRKFVGRRRLLVLAASVVALSFVGGLGAAIAGRAEAVSQRRVAEAARVEADRSAARAEFVTSFLLEDMLAAADPDARPGETITVADLLDGASTAADERFADDPTLLADIKGRLGVAYQRLGRADEAERVLAEAIEAIERANGGPTSTSLAWRFEAAQAMIGQPASHSSAKLAVPELVGLASKALGDTHPTTLRARLLASDYLGKSASAEEVEAIEVATRSLSSDPLLRMETLRYHALKLGEDGRHAEAAEQLRDAVEIATARLGEMHSQTLKLRYSLAEAMIANGEADPGAAVLVDVLDRADRVYEYGHATLSGMQRRAIALFRMAGDRDAALRFAAAFAKASEERSGRGSIAHVSALQELGRSLAEAGRPAEAIELLVDVLRQRREQWGASHVQVAFTLRALADASLMVDDATRAETYAAEAMAILPHSHPSYFAAGRTWAEAMFVAGRSDDARDGCRRLLREARDAGATTDILVGLRAQLGAYESEDDALDVLNAPSFGH